MKILEPISTLILGGIAAYIAWRHWRTDELKRRHDLYERRLKVYDAVMDFFENFEKSDGAEFERQARTSRFLFSIEISAYLDTIYKEWSEFVARKRTLATQEIKPEDPAFSKLSKEKVDIALRLKLQRQIATEKFAKEMSLSKI